jgi:tetratricopeptide (TPR) repeat protein
MHEEALEFFRELDDAFGSAETMASLSAILRSAQEYDAAADLLREALPLYRDLGDRRGIATTLIRLGVDATTRGDLSIARELLVEALEACRQLNDAQGVVASLTYLARTARSSGDEQRSALLLDEAIEWCRLIPGHRTTATCLEEIAGLIAGTEPDRAATLMGAAESLRSALGLSGDRTGQTGYEQAKSIARSTLGEDRFVAAWNQGCGMSPEEAIALARSVPLFG